MAHNTRWWKKIKKRKLCQKCGEETYCFKYQGPGVARCGFNQLCDDCYDRFVKHAYKGYITRRQFLPRLFIFIFGVFTGVPVGMKLIHQSYISRRIRFVTNREKEILVEWALSKAENVSVRTIRLMVDAAGESQFPALIMAIIGAETNPKFDPGSVSRTGACGPMQVMPGVWLRTLVKEGIIHCKEDLFDPTLGVRCGVYIFCHYLEKARGDLKEATRLYLEGIHVKDPKGAAEYFHLIQKYIGEIYLALYKEKKKETIEKEEKDNGKKEGDDSKG